ncbi:hypothetical protein JXM83_00800 [Candidatus Woesearchaeota archaeon]|nr:hypothetical protein [Candidatus Woesearchaeota archaeon]
MFGLGKKKSDASSSSVDRLEALKQQLADLKSKEAELDSRTKQPQVAAVAESQPQVSQNKVSMEVTTDNSEISKNEEVVVQKKIIPSELNDEPPMVVKGSESQSRYVGSVDGVVLEIGAGMSLNLPIRPRMKIDEFIEIAERVKALSALNFEER